MKDRLHCTLILIVCCTIFTIHAFPQRKKPEVKKNEPPKPLQLSKLENAVADELNEVRANPKKYAGYLAEWSKFLNGKMIKLPNQPALRTIEGAAAINDAVADLDDTKVLGSFTISEGLNGAARAQLADLKEDSNLGHVGKDGGDLKTRLARFGTAKGKAGENICHRGRTARDVVLIFLVDDGVESRSHRKAVLSEKFKQIGVACGTGKNAEALCVVEFAENFKDQTDTAPTVEY